MLEKYLISQDDINSFHPLGDIPQGRIDPYIRKAQDLDLKPILNQAFYYDFLLKFDDSSDPMYEAYQNLLNGCTYTYSNQTIEFAGIKPMLCSFALARFWPMQQKNVTRYGIVTKTNATSEPVSSTAITYDVNNFKADAAAYAEQLKQFIFQNTTVYPLYNTLVTSSNNGGTRIFNSANCGYGRYRGWYDGVYYP